MRKLFARLGISVLAGTAALLLLKAASNEPVLLELSGDLAVHDPVVIKHGDTYYLFCTGGGREGQGVIPIRTSKDMRHWTLAGYVFERLPEWASKEIPKARGAWAPDISFFNGKYHLYYSVSIFGVNDSAIGLATNRTLDPNSPDYRWVDEGMVLRSRPGQDDFNAIDPNLVIEDEKNVWLCWGSFWSGIKMRRIDPRTGKFSSADTTVYSLCSRPRQSPPVAPAAQGAVEAPFIVRRGDYWYLFVSYDFCCRGVKSDYKVVVGRSRSITGPYLDREGRSLLEGGGTLVIEAATDKWRGAGHQAVFRDGETDYLFFHAYSVANNGRSQLQISTIVWEDGWPRVARLP